MHKCVRCGRAAESLQEINDGCPCGSKVFVFNREALSIAGEEVRGLGPGRPEGAPSAQEAAAKPGNGKVEGVPGGNGNSGATGENGKGEEGRAPDSYFARMSFTDEDVENIKVVTEGVFSIDLKALTRDPVVLKDEEGIYYVRIPFEERTDGGKGRK